MGQFLPGSPILFTQTRGMEAAPISQEECETTLEALVAHAEAGPGSRSAAPVSKIDWKNILATVLPFILKLFV